MDRFSPYSLRFQRSFDDALRYSQRFSVFLSGLARDLQIRTMHQTGERYLVFISQAAATLDKYRTLMKGIEMDHPTTSRLAQFSEMADSVSEATNLAEASAQLLESMSDELQEQDEMSFLSSGLLESYCNDIRVEFMVSVRDIVLSISTERYHLANKTPPCNNRFILAKFG